MTKLVEAFLRFVEIRPMNGIRKLSKKFQDSDHESVIFKALWQVYCERGKIGLRENGSLWRNPVGV